MNTHQAKAQPKTSKAFKLAVIGLVLPFAVWCIEYLTRSILMLFFPSDEQGSEMWRSIYELLIVLGLFIPIAVFGGPTLCIAAYQTSKSELPDEARLTKAGRWLAMAGIPVSIILSIWLLVTLWPL